MIGTAHCVSTIGGLAQHRAELREGASSRSASRARAKGSAGQSRQSFGEAARMDRPTFSSATMDFSET